MSFAHHDLLSVFLTRPAAPRDAAGGDAADRADRADGGERRQRRGRAAPRPRARGARRGRDGGGGGRRRRPAVLAAATRCWEADLAAPDGADGAAAGETPAGTLLRRTNRDLRRHRCQARRTSRLAWLAATLGRATSCGEPTGSHTADGEKGQEEKSEEEGRWPLSPAMKIVVRFSLDGLPAARRHRGGLHLLAPRAAALCGPAERRHPALATPHVYTVSATHGDHQGVRSWLPTLDSASPRHRATHELSVVVTAAWGEGLWPCGCGEDFGGNARAGHPLLGRERRADAFGGAPPPRGEEEGAAAGDGDPRRRGAEEAERVWAAADARVEGALGRGHARFAGDFFYSTGDRASRRDARHGGGEEPPPPAADDEALLSVQLPALALLHRAPAYVTALFSSFVHTPCPSRSLGFVVGPFAPPLYDPEYFRADGDDEAPDGDARGEGGEGGEGGNPGLRETARRSGEGIRQLYFAPAVDRPWIHRAVTDGLIFGGFGPAPRPPPRPALATAHLRHGCTLT